MSEAQNLDASGRTDRGRVRLVNEDHFLIGQLDKSLFVTQTSLPAGGPRRLIGAPEGQVLCVADGLGGHVAGERASAAAVDSTMHYLLHTMPCFFRARSLCDDELRKQLTTAFLQAQSELRLQMAHDQELRGMGTTLTLAFVQWPWLHLVHVGDSRCYLLRDGLRQISTDHTIVQRLIDSGTVSVAEAQNSPLRHALWNAIGQSGSAPYVEIAKHELRAGDTILLCSDGLTNHLEDAAIGDILEAAKDACEATMRLIEAANDAGGSDNITAIVVRVPAGLDPEHPDDVRLMQDPPDATRLCGPPFADLRADKD